MSQQSHDKTHLKKKKKADKDVCQLPVQMLEGLFFFFSQALMTSGLEHGESRLILPRRALSGVSVSAHSGVSFSRFWQLLGGNARGPRLVRGERSPEIRSAASAYFKAYFQLVVSCQPRAPVASGCKCIFILLYIPLESTGQG